MGERGADSREPLKHVQFPGGYSFWLSIVAAEATRTCSAHLGSEEAHDSQGILWSARMKYRQTPHDGQGHDRPCDGIRMDIWQAWRHGSLQ